MAAYAGPVTLAATGSTGNNSHASAKPSPDGDKAAVVFTVEAVGGAPTVTYKVQATFDADTVADGSANWTDLILLPAGSETAAVSATVTAVGQYVSFLAQAHTRFVRRIRVVTSANTNVTYRSDLHQHLKP
jgi:hypothetical protein